MGYLNIKVVPSKMRNTNLCFDYCYMLTKLNFSKTIFSVNKMYDCVYSEIFNRKSQFAILCTYLMKIILYSFQQKNIAR